ncbi:uncharacterized protein N7459_000523 [Penicillium hispanicum]|uniref:uncharacterized protein n=1 Tax=Penicillium hispanicum TaxID=1080232 RepID=UPI002541C8C3|nr:uncharacterized protein N7459_000523 [Penicillium hispanicum]KAJ5594315.1 hypothetical protein N7459_000523 [Penicillium hispanicum]
MDQDWNSSYFDLDRPVWDYGCSHDPMTESSATLRPLGNEVTMEGAMPTGIFSSGVTYPVTGSQGSSYPTSQFTASTSETSFDHDMFVVSGYTERQISSQRVPPGVNDHDLIGIQPRHEQEGAIPQTLNIDEDPGGAEAAPSVTLVPCEASPQVAILDPEPDLETAASREMIGISDPENGPLGSHPPDLIQDLDHVRSVLLSPSECNSADLFESQRSLGNLTEHINNLIRIQGLDVMRTRSPSIAGSIEPPSRASERYRCLLCDNKEFNIRGSFMRHVDYFHHNRFEYHCPEEGCPEILRRRDKVIHHCRVKHERAANPDEIANNKHQLPCPQQCSICRCITSSWEAFYACFLTHCHLHHGLADETPSRRSSIDRGSTATNNRPTVIPSSGRFLEVPGAGLSAQQHDMRDYHSRQGLSSSFPGDNGGTRSAAPRAISLVRSRLGPMVLTNLETLSETPSLWMGLMDLAHRKDLAHCKVLPNGVHFHPEDKASDNAGDATTSSTTVVIVLFDRHTQIGAIDAPISLCSSSGPALPLPPIPQLQTGIARNSLQRRPSGASGGSRGRRYRVAAVADIHQRGLSEIDMEQPPMLKSQMAQPVGTWMDHLPIRIPFVAGPVKPPKVLGALAYEDATTQSDLPPPAATTSPKPPSKFQCPYRASSETSYFGSARANVADDEHLEMNMKFLPEDRTGHPLRTRVQLVVKLLKLRSSVAALSDKTKRTKTTPAVIAKDVDSTADRSRESIVVRTPDLDCSGTESVLSDTGLSRCSSFTDLSLFEGDETPTGVFETEGEVAFHFDLQSSLDKLSQRSGGQSAVIDPDLAVYDPSRVLEYFFRYILYVMMALRHSPSRDHALGSRLGD